jgi:short-subunit dehydrogenase involved in D-alanine esterification of teichoic acids
LKLKCDEVLSNFAFKFNVRGYVKATAELLKIANDKKRSTMVQVGPGLGFRVRV